MKFQSLNHAKMPVHGHGRGFTITEVVVSLALIGLTVGGVASGYLAANQYAEWMTTSTAAHDLAMQRVEQVRAARWNPEAYPPVDELVETNFPPLVRPLFVPLGGTNVVYGTNTTTISTLNPSPPLKMILNECCWPGRDGGVQRLRQVIYRSPDA
jgi:prepilin-type N-terminal cleavage/methylation domain-containing protein